LKIFGETLQHLTTRIRLLAALFIVHLCDEMHELLHRQQDGAPLGYVLNGQVKTVALTSTQSAKPSRINLAQQTEQRLARGSLNLVAQDL
jgi:hypothetical protein